jgi:FKBP12-rapamycin complex-associated protein
VSGIEGTFRCTASSVMRVLRENKESVMAVLEAFVYDPLINWRLLATQKQQMHGDEATQAATAQANQVANAHAEGGVVVATGAGGAGGGAGAGGAAVAPGDSTTGVAAAALAAGENPITSTTGAATVVLPLGADAPSDSEGSEVLNAKAVSVIARVESKLQGRDFDAGIVLDTQDQVEKLIQQATSHTNLCQCYVSYTGIHVHSRVS